MIPAQYLTDQSVKILERMLVKRPNFISIAIYHENILLIVTSVCKLLPNEIIPTKHQVYM